MKYLSVIGLLALCAACGDGGEEPIEPLFPQNYAGSFDEVRDCRRSSDHDLHQILVLANSTAFSPYANRDEPFPPGSILLKEEREFGDEACEGEIISYAVMMKLEEGESPDTLDWTWQRVRPDFTVQSQDESRCIGCHEACELPDGYLFTCAAVDSGG